MKFIGFMIGVVLVVVGLVMCTNVQPLGVGQALGGALVLLFGGATCLKCI